MQAPFSKKFRKKYRRANLCEAVYRNGASDNGAVIDLRMTTDKAGNTSKPNMR